VAGKRAVFDELLGYRSAWNFSPTSLRRGPSIAKSRYERRRVISAMGSPCSSTMASHTRDFTVDEMFFMQLYFQCGPGPRPMAGLAIFRFEYSLLLVKVHGRRLVNLNRDSLFSSSSRRSFSKTFNTESRKRFNSTELYLRSKPR